MMIYAGTKSKIKPKLKPKAERQQYEEWCKKHGITSKRKKPTTNIKLPTVVCTPYIRETEEYRSLGSFVTGSVTVGKNSTKVYTGDKMIGIAQMAKSNAVPIFTAEHVVEVARMRR